MFPLRKACRMSLLSAWSISLDSTFNHLLFNCFGYSNCFAHSFNLSGILSLIRQLFTRSFIHPVDVGKNFRVLNSLEGPLSKFSTFVHRGSSHWRKSGAYPKFYLVWLHRSPIPVERRRLIFTFNWFLPAFSRVKTKFPFLKINSTALIPPLNGWFL